MTVQETPLHSGHLLIAGRRITGKGRATRPVLNPATGAPVGEVTLATQADIEEAAEAASRGFDEWRTKSPLQRGRILTTIANELRERATLIARQLTLEQGKTLREAVGEVQGAADLFEWVAEEGKRIYGRVVLARQPGYEQLVLHEPVGPVAAFAPWNYPLALSARKISHALAAGCSVVIKPAEEAPSAVLTMAGICLEAGVPSNALQVLFGVPAQISEALIASKHIRKISFTGSVSVGKHLAAQAGGALKKMTMELGGHSPVIVMDDANVDRFVEEAVAGKFRNAGQICISPTRFLVHDAIYDEVTRRFAERAGQIRVGDGLSTETDMGPLALERRLGAMHDLFDNALTLGAKALTKPGRRSGAGYFWQPTVLSEVPVNARIMSEEPFGPIAPFARFSDRDEAISIANSLEYGLAAYAYTNSLDHAHAIKHGLRAGIVGINTFGVTSPEVPFQGIRDSGLGSAMGIEGLIDHMHVKSIVQRVSWG